jgi:hypothetical protein
VAVGPFILYSTRCNPRPNTQRCGTYPTCPINSPRHALVTQECKQRRPSRVDGILVRVRVSGAAQQGHPQRPGPPPHAVLRRDGERTPCSINFSEMGLYGLVTFFNAAGALQFIKKIRNCIFLQIDTEL